MTELEVRARDFATTRHAAAGQVRKYSGEPYINHPAAVVELVRSVAHTPAMLAAAWLHDTVEDTDATLDDIARYFGAEVAQLVEMLTTVYLAEKALLLEVLRDGDATLWRRAGELVCSPALPAPRGARGVRGSSFQFPVFGFRCSIQQPVSRKCFVSLCLRER